MHNAAEILAPVGGGEQLLAAVRCGADAVYLGAKGFNARRNADNFDQTSLKDAVAYCHARGVRVHVTVNTVVMDDEMDALEETAREVAESGADAVIIQDMAVLKLFRDRCPGIALHASTQTAVHNTDGAKFLADLGFDRFVLARELSLKEIEKINNAVSIESESFIHGALCMSLSGGCYLSSVIGGRSGNRGLCAQPCRLDFRLGETDHALSLKDMSHVDHIRELADAGVCSFKIEGRMKRPEYVAAAVSACRAALRGEPYDKESLQAVFSRSGFTDGYFTGRRNHTMFGYRTKEDVKGAEGVLGNYASLYRREMPLVPVDASFSMKRNATFLTLTSGDDRVSVTGDAPEAARTRPTDEESVRRSVEKLGGTPFYLENLSVDLLENCMIPASSLNALRREAAEKLLEKKEAPQPKELLPREEEAFPASAHTSNALWGRFSAPEQIPDPDTFQKIFLPLLVIDKTPEWIARYGEKLAAELPSIVFPEDEDAVYAALQRVKNAGIKEIAANNIYAVQMGKDLGMTVHGGWGLNLTNSTAMALYQKAGLSSALISFELSMNRIGTLSGDLPRGYLAYGYLPLMRMRSCPARNDKGCGNCDGKHFLHDRTGRDFRLQCQDRRYSVLLNDVPLYIGDKRRSDADYQLLYFTVEEPDRVRTVTDAFLSGLPIEGGHTNGLYFRTLQ